MTTLTTLDAEYADLLRVRASAIPAADAATISGLARTVDNGSLTLAAATTTVTRLAINTTDVAVLSYQFFTGATPYQSGLDYLVSPASSNTNNLNSAYYRSFNIENRFINFAVNLGKLGEGAQRFSAAYGTLSLSDTLVQAYTTIFGFAPGAAQVASLLNDAVPNGLGGTETRAQYFASYGGDGLTGIGTKAALVGWLLAQAVKEDVGTYAKANDAFLADLAPDGLARFHVDLVAAYGPQAASAPGAVITFSADQSVSPTSVIPALRSTSGADTITTTGNVNSGVMIATGDGNDTLTIPGVVNGTVTLGGGNNTVTLGGVDQGTIPGRYGSVTLGGGNNTVYLTGGMEAGTTLLAGGYNNVLHLSAPGPVTFAAIDTGKPTIIGFQTVYIDSAAGAAGVPASAEVVYDDIPTPPGQTADTLRGLIGLSEGVGRVVVLQNTSLGINLSSADPNAATLFLDHYTGGPTTAFGGTVLTALTANGGPITFQFTDVPAGVTSIDAVATIHVSSDSTAGLISGFAYTTQVSSSNFGRLSAPLHRLVITGAGSLTAQLDVQLTDVDASGAGDLTLSYAVGATSIFAAAASNLFRFSNGVDSLTVTFASVAPIYSTTTTSYSSATRFIFGLGANTLTVAGTSLADLSLNSAQTVSAPSQIEGFKKGIDHLVLDAVTATLTPGVQTFVGAAATLTQALVNVSTHVAANTGAVFEFGGDTYVYQQDATVGLNTGDGLIRLVGVTGLSTASGSAVGDIHVHG